MADQHITVKLPQLPAWPPGDPVRADDMLYVWDSETGRLCHAPVSALPFGSGTGAGGTSTVLASPFMVGRGDPQVSVDGGQTTVSDARLLGKSGYPVTATQINNAAFRPGEITYDPLAGTCALPGFELLGGDYLVLYPTGGQPGGAGGVLQPLWDRIAALEAMLAPFAPTATDPAPGRVWWTGKPSEIPAGWAEDETMRGYYPAHSPAPASTGPLAVGKIDGNFTNKVTLTGRQQGAIKFRVQRSNRKGRDTVPSIQGIAFASWGSNEWAESFGWEAGGDQHWGPERTFRPGEGLDPVDIRPSTRYGMWIKYVGA